MDKNMDMREMFEIGKVDFMLGVADKLGQTPREREIVGALRRVYEDFDVPCLSFDDIVFNLQANIIEEAINMVAFFRSRGDADAIAAAEAHLNRVRFLMNWANILIDEINVEYQHEGE